MASARAPSHAGLLHHTPLSHPEASEFRVRLAFIDHYLATPLPGIDATWSSLHGSPCRKVPVIRIFGALPSGHTACIHVHQVFPYFYVPYYDDLPRDAEQAPRCLDEFAQALDCALALSRAQLESALKSPSAPGPLLPLAPHQRGQQRVWSVTLVRAAALYGFQDQEQAWIRVALFNPRDVKKAAELLLAGAVLGRRFQPHESHIPFLLQFKMDYNLFGMDWVRVRSVLFRPPAKPATLPIIPDPHPTPCSWSDALVSSQAWPHDQAPRRHSSSAVEGDVVAEHLLNRGDAARVRSSAGEGKRFAIHSLAAMWEEESARFQGGIPPPPPLPERNPVPLAATGHHLARFAAVLAAARGSEAKGTDLQASGVQAKEETGLWEEQTHASPLSQARDLLATPPPGFRSGCHTAGVAQEWGATSPAHASLDPAGSPSLSTSVQPQTTPRVVPGPSRLGFSQEEASNRAMIAPTPPPVPLFSTPRPGSSSTSALLDMQAVHAVLSQRPGDEEVVEEDEEEVWRAGIKPGTPSSQLVKKGQVALFPPLATQRPPAGTSASGAEAARWLQRRAAFLSSRPAALPQDRTGLGGGGGEGGDDDSEDELLLALADEVGAREGGGTPERVLDDVLLASQRLEEDAITRSACLPEEAIEGAGAEPLEALVPDVEDLVQAPDWEEPPLWSRRQGSDAPPENSQPRASRLIPQLDGAEDGGVGPVLGDSQDQEEGGAVLGDSQQSQDAILSPETWTVGKEMHLCQLPPLAWAAASPPDSVLPDSQPSPSALESALGATPLAGSPRQPSRLSLVGVGGTPASARAAQATHRSILASMSPVRLASRLEERGGGDERLLVSETLGPSAQGVNGALGVALVSPKVSRKALVFLEGSKDTLVSSDDLRDASLEDSQVALASSQSRQPSGASNPRSMPDSDAWDSGMEWFDGADSNFFCGDDATLPSDEEGAGTAQRLVPRVPPPSVADLWAEGEQTDIPLVAHTPIHASDLEDARLQPVVMGGRAIRIPCFDVAHTHAFNGEAGEDWKTGDSEADEEKNDALGVTCAATPLHVFRRLVPAALPPSCKEATACVRRRASEELSKRAGFRTRTRTAMDANSGRLVFLEERVADSQKPGSSSSPPAGTAATPTPPPPQRRSHPPSSHGPASRRLTPPRLGRGGAHTPPSQVGFKLGDAEGSLGLTTVCVETLGACRGSLLPDPRFDPALAVALSVLRDRDSVAEGAYEAHLVLLGKAMGPDPAVSGPTRVHWAANEADLIDLCVELVQALDPDVLVSWDVQREGLGYLLDRAAMLRGGEGSEGEQREGKEGLDQPGTPPPAPAPPLTRLLSRSPGVEAETEAWEDEYGAAQGSGIIVPGRLVLNGWRVMRGEVKLALLTLQSVCSSALQLRLPCVDPRQLARWFTGQDGGSGGAPDDRAGRAGKTRAGSATASPPSRWRALEDLARRARAMLRLLDDMDVLGRHAALARVTGIDLTSAFCRGSQYRVESLLVRLAHASNQLALSPSRAQVGSQPAMEVPPLVMEPVSRVYTDPVVVLDFQSFYPSIMAAYNLCYSTLLGKPHHFAAGGAGEDGGEAKKGDPDTLPRLGCTRLPRPVSLLAAHLEGCVVAANGAAFASPDVRRGALPRLAEEILSTRLMLKRAQSVTPANRRPLLRSLEARQWGLKMLANVVYGYAGAGYSGRMPSAELADAIVGTARATLERAMRLVEEHPRWRARVVYGDTDSMFVLLRGRSRQEADAVGREIAAVVTAQSPAPVTLRMEKVYWPCVLQTKKRYAGYLWESAASQAPVLECKGLETVRRDSCPAVAKLLDQALRALFDSRDLTAVRRRCEERWTRLLRGAAPVQDYVFCREVRLGTYSARGSLPPAAVVAARAAAADPRAEPAFGARVPFVVLAGPPGSTLAQLVAGPAQALEGGRSLHAGYYIARQEVPALGRVLRLVGVDPQRWFDALPRPRARVPRGLGGGGERGSCSASRPVGLAGVAPAAAAGPASLRASPARCRRVVGREGGAGGQEVRAVRAAVPVLRGRRGGGHGRGARGVPSGGLRHVVRPPPSLA